MKIAKLSIAFSAAILLTLPAWAAGKMEAACLAQGQPASTCSCSQEVADERLSLEDQERFIAISSDPSKMFALGAQGVEGEAFLEKVTVFSEEVERRCE